MNGLERRNGVLNQLESGSLRSYHISMLPFSGQGTQIPIAVPLEAANVPFFLSKHDLEMLVVRLALLNLMAAPSLGLLSDQIFSWLHGIQGSLVRLWGHVVLWRWVRVKTSRNLSLWS
jgi:hypothetical protein